MRDSNSGLPMRYDIQGLRALAVSLVVLAHANVEFFAGGFIGVDVFFVLSGYLITGLLVEEHELSGRIRYVRFLARRLRRLLPALVCMLVLVVLFSELLLPPFEARMRTGSLAFAVSWTSNFYFALTEFDYFSKVANKDLFLHTWSLGVEEQFYLIWPLLIALILSTRLVGMGSRRRTRNALLAFMAAIACIGVAFSWYWSQSQQTLSFYMMPGRASQFAIGAMVFAALSSRDGGQKLEVSPHNSRFACASLVATGLVLVVGSACLISPYLNYPDYSAVFPTAGAALVIFGGAGLQSSRLNLVLGNPALTWIGDRSYSIYLWHWPVILIATAYGLMSNLIQTLSVVLLAFTLGSWSYRYIEKPFWKGRLSIAAPAQVVAVSAAIMLSTAVLGSMLRDTSNSGVEIAQSDGAVNPRFDRPSIYGQVADCDSWFSSADVVPCFMGGVTGKKTAMLIGDSIGAQWASMLPAIFREPNWRSVVLTKSACPMVDKDYYYDAVGGIYSICSEWREAAVDFIVRAKPDVLFIGSSSHYEFSREQWVDGLASIVDQLHQDVSDIILVPGTPMLEAVSARCAMSESRLSRLFPGLYSGCTSVAADSRSADVARYLAEVADKYSNVHVLDLGDLVCPRRICSVASESGTVIYRDDRHLTNSFVVSQVPQIRKLLAEKKLGMDEFDQATVMGSE